VCVRVFVCVRVCGGECMCVCVCVCAINKKSTLLLQMFDSTLFSFF